MLEIRSENELQGLERQILKSCVQPIELLRSGQFTEIELFRHIKFEKIGLHPIENRSINFIEQVNQTFTYLACIKAVRQLYALHPNVSGFVCDPGASAKTRLDILSIENGLIGAEVFASVIPSNNNKLSKDQAKLSNSQEQFRYSFFISPKYPFTERHKKMEKHLGVEVWSLEY